MSSSKSLCATTWYAKTYGGRTEVERGDSYIERQGKEEKGPGWRQE